jgi:hypothetical protein
MSTGARAQWRKGAIAALLITCLPCVAGGQSIDLRLREDSTGRAVAGALVRLLGSSGTVAQGLSNEAGRVVLRGAAITRDIRLPEQRVVLPELVVHGTSAWFPIGQAGTLAATLWEEIRKALTASIISADDSVPLHVRVFRRQLDSAGKPTRERLTRSVVSRGHRYGAVAAKKLADKGYVYPDERGFMLFAAPDAETILDGEFTATHLFRAVAGDEGLVGLAFKPARRGRSDVEGVLWVRRESSELSHLEFGYTDIPGPVRGLPPGGMLRFQRLGAGAWIVSEWHIRSPWGLGRTGEQGARVAIAGDSLRITRAIVAGMVWDSTEGRGLADATVWIEGIPDSIITDFAGGFELAVEDTGARPVRVRHWKFDALGGPPSQAVTLAWGDTARVSFVAGAPSEAPPFCSSPGEAGLLAQLTHYDGRPGIGHHVEGSWDAADGNHKELVEVQANGLFAFCWRERPRGDLTIRVLRGTRDIVRHAIRPGAAGFKWVEVRIP